MREGMPPSRVWGHYISFAAIGLEMVAPIAVGMLVDRNYGVSPWATMAGALIGFVVGIAHSLMILKHTKNGSKSERDRAG